MTKTIEEAAREYDSNASITSENFYSEAISDAFESGAEYIMSLPLASRLTVEEKERVRTKYNAAKIGATEFDSPECADLMDILEDIFSTDFFKEGE